MKNLARVFVPVGVVAMLGAVGLFIFSRRPNSRFCPVILISIDGLRPDHLGCYGYPRNTSPELDAVARQGVMFLNSLSSSSWTLPAHMSLFTSLPPSLHGVRDNGDSLDPRRITLAEVFREHGYRTAAFVGGPYLDPAFGFEQGFDVYDTSAVYPQGFVFNHERALSPTEEMHRLSHRMVNSQQITDRIVRWLGNIDTRKPFFLFVHYWDVHWDYVPHASPDTVFDPDYRGAFTGENLEKNEEIKIGMPEEDLRHLIALYDGEIKFVDKHVGQLVRVLKARGVYGPCLMIITSDHGQEFLEHGGKGHQRTLFDEVIRIPLIMKMPDPGSRAVPQAIVSQTSLMDIAPTILDCIGLDFRKSFPGTRSLLGVISSPATYPGLPVLSELFVNSKKLDIISLRTPRWKIIWDEKQHQFSFFLLENDRGETRDLADEPLPELSEARLKLAEVMQSIEERRRSGAFARSRTSKKLEPKLEEYLRSLGYLE